MKVEGKVLLGIGAFFGVVGTIYWITTYHYGNHWEASGTLMLFGTMLLGLVPGGYYFWWSKRMKPRPEDDPNATHEGSTGIVAVFPSSSVWPFFIGLAATLVCIGLVFGIWTAAVGVPLAFIAVTGIIRESRRGGAV
ncbi:MAG: aa3-type cytochrome oxidase subunit IV [Acidimicrobiales bacterium]